MNNCYHTMHVCTLCMCARYAYVHVTSTACYIHAYIEDEIVKYLERYKNVNKMGTSIGAEGVRHPA